MIKPTMLDLNKAAFSLAARMDPPPGVIVAIPRGGVPSALLVARHLTPVPAVVLLDELTGEENWDRQGPVWIVDDILATGQTIAKVYKELELSTIIDGVAVFYSRLPLMEVNYQFLYDELVPEGGWVTFPWERMATGEDERPTEAVVRLLEFMGEDPNREGLVDTPARVLRYLAEVRDGAGDFEATTFPTKHDDLIVEADIPFSSLCEHHMLPYYGTASVGYIPDGKLLGLSKFARFVHLAARGLTTQEDLTRVSAESIAKAAGVESVAVFTKAVHTCTELRGVKAVGAEARMSVTLGEFRANPTLRAEFFAIVQGRDRV